MLELAGSQVSEFTSLSESHFVFAETSFRAPSLTSLVTRQLIHASSPLKFYTMSERPPLPADPYANLHRERYTIARPHNHVLVVLPSSIKVHFVNGVFEERRGPPQAAYEFEVSLEALHKIAYFRRTVPFDKAAHGTSELRDDDPLAWKLWLEMVHGCLDNQSYYVRIPTVWHVLRIADKYDINPKCADAGKWFDQWFFTQSAEGIFTDNGKVRQILFPCHAFDHALGFTTCTMWLVYNCAGHIAEERPKEFEHHPRLGLDHGIERVLY